MVKIRKPKKENKEVIPVDNPEVIQEGISKAEEFITKNKSTKISNIIKIKIFIIDFKCN